MMVVGDAGVGKSRLLDEFLSSVDLDPEPVLLLQARGNPESCAHPYSYLRTMFSFRFSIADDDDPGLVRAKFRSGIGEALSELETDLLGALLGYDFSSSPDVAERLNTPGFIPEAIRGWYRYLDSVSEDQTVLVVLEDLHYADDASLQELLSLEQRLSSKPLFVFALARPEIRDRVEPPVFARRIDLDPLTSDASTKLVRTMFQRAERVPPELLDFVVGAANGNPYYLEELVKMLIDDGVVEVTYGTWVVKPERLNQGKIPTTLAGVLQARLFALDLWERRVLQRASVIGRTFWADAVAALSEPDDPDLDLSELLRTLRDRELIHAADNSSFRFTNEFAFKHGLLRDVVYETVLLKFRRPYHLRTAEWLVEQTRDRQGEFAAVIAQHFERAGDTGQAMTYYLIALRALHQKSAHAEALAIARNVIELSAQSSGVERAELLYLAGESARGVSDFGVAADYYIRSAKAAQESEAVVFQARSLIELVQCYFVPGDFDKAERTKDEVFSLIDAHTGKIPLSVQQRAHYQTSFLYNFSGNDDKAIYHGEQCLKLSNMMDDPGAAVGARNALGLACRMKHRDRSITCMREGLEIARDHLPGHDYAVAAANLGEILQIDGQFQEAEALLSEALGIFREVRKVHGAVNCLNHIGFCRLQIGDVDGGLARFSEAAAMCRDNNLMTALGTSLAGWVEAKLIAGNVAGAATLCTFVEQLDISVSEAIVEINRIKPLIEQRLKPTELQAARERAADLNFDETVEQLVGLHEPPPDSPTART